MKKTINRKPVSFISSDIMGITKAQREHYDRYRYWGVNNMVNIFIYIVEQCLETIITIFHYITQLSLSSEIIVCLLLSTSKCEHDILVMILHDILKL